MTAGVLAIVSVAVLFQSPDYAPAVFNIDADLHPIMTVYPMTGFKVTRNVPLPGWAASGLPGSDGKSIYLVPHPLEHGGSGPHPITRVDFHPTRLSGVPGSEEFTFVPHLRVLADGNIVALGCKSGNADPCGLYEIDPAAATSRLLHATDRQHDIGGISPDGKRVISLANNKRPPPLSILDLTSGAEQLIKRATAASWSPDGRWLMVMRNGDLELLDATTLTRRRDIGSADSMGAWSPDSKYFAYYKTQHACEATPYSSIAVLDVSTGKRRVIESSHCDVTNGPIFWLDPALMTPAN